MVLSKFNDKILGKNYKNICTRIGTISMIKLTINLSFIRYIRFNKNTETFIIEEKTFKTLLEDCRYCQV